MNEEIQYMFNQTIGCYENGSVDYSQLNIFSKIPKLTEKICDIYMNEYEKDKSNPKAQGNLTEKIANLIESNHDNNYTIISKLISKIVF